MSMWDPQGPRPVPAAVRKRGVSASEMAAWPFAVTPAELDAAASFAEEDLATAELAADASAEALHWFALHPASEVRRCVATNWRTPTAVLDLLADDERAAVRSAVAMHPNASLRALMMMVYDPDDQVRLGVARNATLPPEFLQDLAEDDNPTVRLAVARHPQVPVASLCRLARDPEPDVRVATAQAERTPPGVLVDLSYDSQARVRFAVVRHPHVPLRALSHLVRDINPAIRQEAEMVMANQVIPRRLPCDHCGHPLPSDKTADECTFCQDLCLEDHEAWLRLLGCV